MLLNEINNRSKRVVKDKNLESRLSENALEVSDPYFIETIVPQLKKKKLLPPNLGELIGSGFEGVVYSLGADRVLKLHITYEMWEEQAEEVFEKYKSAHSGGQFAKIFSVKRIEGKIDGLDDGGEKLIIAIAVEMEKLDPISRRDAETIDAVILKKMKVDDVGNPELRSFLEKYMTMNIDVDARNVMMRGEQYVIIDA